MDVGRDPFAPYSGDLGNHHPEGMSLPFFLLSLHFFLCVYIYIYIHVF